MTALSQTRVLFVDDEPLVLRSIDRALRTRKVPWEARFVDSGGAALELLTSERFDVVIADLRIPDLDGVELLTIVQRMYPKIARLVLSGEWASLRPYARGRAYAPRSCLARTCLPRAWLTRSCPPRSCQTVRTALPFPKLPPVCFSRSGSHPDG